MVQYRINIGNIEQTKSTIQFTCSLSTMYVYCVSFFHYLNADKQQKIRAQIQENYC